MREFLDNLPFKTALIVEDEVLIAIDIEQLLQSMGCRHIELISSQNAACAWLETNTPDVAIIDVRLMDGDSTALALDLAQRSVPFIVHSALLDGIDACFDRGLPLAKPATPEQIMNALFALFPR